MWIVKLVHIAPEFICYFHFKCPGLKKHKLLGVEQLAWVSEPPCGSHGRGWRAALGGELSPTKQPNWSDFPCVWAIHVFSNRLALISNELSSVKWVSWLLATGHIDRVYLQEEENEYPQMNKTLGCICCCRLLPAQSKSGHCQLNTTPLSSQ